MRESLALTVLNRMLEGQEVEESDLKALADIPRPAPDETLYIDFKDGSLLGDRRPAETVRKFVAGFANADGGLLVIGVSEPIAGKREFTHAVAPGGKTLVEWARNSLEPLAGRLVPGPRIQVVRADGKDVLVIGVSRTPMLVTCIEVGRPVYYLRFADSTQTVPAYLESDLLLGRREHPQLQVRSEGTAGAANSQLVHFGFVVDNESMVPARDVVVGVIAWALPPRDERTARPAPHSLRMFIDAIPPPKHYLKANRPSWSM